MKLYSSAVSGTVTTDTFNARHIAIYSFSFAWTGTLLGNVSVAVSNDNVKWITITESMQSTAGTTGEHMVNVMGAGYMFVKGQYEHISGSGTLDVDIYWK